MHTPVRDMTKNMLVIESVGADERSTVTAAPAVRALR